jgi:hypothetical protein
MAPGGGEVQANIPFCNQVRIRVLGLQGRNVVHRQSTLALLCQVLAGKAGEAEIILYMQEMNSEQTS